MFGSLGANAIKRFTVFRISFAPDFVMDACLRHQIAFVCGIDKHFRAKDFAILHRDFGDSRAFFLYAFKALLEKDGSLRLVRHLEKNVFGDMRFEGPHSRVRRIQIQGDAAHASFEIIFAFFELPGVVACVMLSDAMIKLARDTANGGFISDVGRAEAARSHAPEMISELGNYGRFAHPRSLDRRRYTSHSAAINADRKSTRLNSSHIPLSRMPSS